MHILSTILIKNNMHFQSFQDHCKRSKRDHAKKKRKKKTFVISEVRSSQTINVLYRPSTVPTLLFQWHTENWSKRMTPENDFHEFALVPSWGHFSLLLFSLFSSMNPITKPNSTILKFNPIIKILRWFFFFFFTFTENNLFSKIRFFVF